MRISFEKSGNILFYVSGLLSGKKHGSRGVFSLYVSCFCVADHFFFFLNNAGFFRDNVVWVRAESGRGLVSRSKAMFFASLLSY